MLKLRSFTKGAWTSASGGSETLGGGEELGGLRGLLFYMQRVALEGSRGTIESLSGSERSAAETPRK